MMHQGADHVVEFPDGHVLLGLVLAVVADGKGQGIVIYRTTPVRRLVEGPTARLDTGERYTDAAQTWREALRARREESEKLQAGVEFETPDGPGTDHH